MVQYISDRVAVMYLGKIVELAPVGGLYGGPAASLLDRAALGGAGARSTPSRSAASCSRATCPVRPIRPRAAASGPAAGCANSSTDPEICETTEPPLRDIGGGHLAACHFTDKVTPEATEKAAHHVTLSDITDEVAA